MMCRERALTCARRTHARALGPARGRRPGRTVRHSLARQSNGNARARRDTSAGDRGLFRPSSPSLFPNEESRPFLSSLLARLPACALALAVQRTHVTDLLSCRRASPRVRPWHRCCDASGRVGRPPNDGACMHTRFRCPAPLFNLL